MREEVALLAARRSLLGRAKALKSVRFERYNCPDIHFKDLRTERGVEILGEAIKVAQSAGASGALIYRIYVSGGNASHEIIRKYKEYIQTGKYRLPRLNQVSASETLYIGRSNAILARLRQHLSCTPQQTYALYLGAWCADVQGSFSIKILAAQIPLDDRTFQDVEDALWDHFKPIFGRRGPK